MLTPGAYDPRFMKPATLCRCGHILECCADCMGWLRDNSVRIADGWRWFVTWRVGTTDTWGDLKAADAAEADNLAYYLSIR